MKRAALTLLVGPLLACGGVAANPAPPPKDLNVFAAASLTASFTALGRSFETAHPRVRVRLNFAGSSTLARQILEGAAA